MRFAAFLLALVCSARCAIEHQPQLFSPYFALQPESYYSSKHVYETQTLERIENQTPHQKKRLFDLYTLELVHTRSEPRKSELRLKLDALKTETAPIEQELESIAGQLKARRQPSEAVAEEGSFEGEEQKLKYFEARNLWNKDNNTEALEILRALRSPSSNRKTSLKVEYLFFRVVLESGDLPAADQSYQQIKALSRCSFESEQSALLLSLLYFANDQATQATGILQPQCEPDKSLSTMNRRNYWLARFAGGPAAREAFLQLARSPLPDYYSVMARYHTSQSLDAPVEIALTPGTVPAPLSVPAKIERLLSRSEECLRANLKRDASVYLSHASALLQDRAKQSDLRTSLYVIQLFQAAGNHLAAMRMYNWLITITTDDSVDSLYQFPLIQGMFPRPFKNRVEWLADSWRVDADMVYALMRQESAFNPGAISPANARGLMQLMPFLAKYLARQWGYDSYYDSKNLLNSTENLKLAIFHLYQLNELVPHLALVASSYNAGLSRTTRWWKKFGKYPLDVFIELIPVLETRNYVKYVIRNYAYYKALRLQHASVESLFTLTIPAIPGELPAESISQGSRK